jgi:ligand-binding sensor domain-containing protein
MFAPFVMLVVLLTTLPCIEAQNRIDTWTTDNGLPRNSITGLTQTADGYIWFTTNDGSSASTEFNSRSSIREIQNGSQP